MSFLKLSSKKYLTTVALPFCLFLLLAVFLPNRVLATSAIYDFTLDTVGQTPSNTTATAGTSEVANQATLGKSMRILTANGSNLGSVFMNNFSLTTNYSVIWKQAYDSTGGRAGFILRAQSADSVVAGARRGYYFNVNDSGAATAPNTARIYLYSSGTITVLQSTALTSATPRWFKATVNGSTLSFFYSDDGVNYTQIGTNVTDSTYASGVGVQFILNGAGPSNDYVDDVIQTDSADVTAPTAPTSLTGTVSSTQVALTWASSTDAVGVTAYRIYQCSGSSCTPTTLIATSTTLSYTPTSLSPSTQYGFAVSAFDAAYNESSKSSTFATTTTASADVTAPTAPTSLTGTVSPTQVALTWASSTDAVGVTAYKVYQCSGASCSPTTFVATSTTLSYTPTGLTPSTQYGFAVSATDAAFNESSKSSTFATTTTSSSAITFTSPKSYQVIQRNGSNQGNISITGTYTGSPTSIEASFNGGAYSTIVASPSGGTFTGTLSNQSQGQGTLSVRFTNDTAVATSTTLVGIGDIYVVAGQSNASSRGVTNNAYSHVTLKATMFGNNDVWADLADPLDSSTGQIDSVSSDSFAQMGSPYPLVATSFLADQGVPIAFIPVAKGGTNITAWARNLATTTLYGSMYRRINAAGGSVKGILWYQGESDGDAGLDHGSGLGATRANYLADLTTLANNVNSDFGTKLIVTQLAYSGAPPHVAYFDEVRLAQKDAWDAGGNVLPGPAFPDVNLNDETGITGGDNIHFKSDGDQLIQANRIWAALKKDFYGGTDGRGPRLSTLNWGTSRSQILVTFTDDTLPLLPASSIGGFAVTDSVGAKTISSATRTSNGVITLTLSSAAVGATTVNLATMNTGIAVNMPTDSSSFNLPAEIFQNEPVTDNTAPTVSITAPSDLATVSGSSVSVTANSADNIGVSGVQFKLDGANLGSEDTVSTYGITWDTTTTTNGSHTLLAVSRDASGNYATSTAITVTVSNSDVTAPTAPTSLTGTVSPTQVALTWASSTDAGGVTAYKVYRCTGSSCSPTTFIATTTVLSYTDTSLSASTQYGFAVSAVDAAFNESSKSSTFATTTTAVPDTTAPTAPTSLTGTVSPTQVALTWASSTDAVGVTAYKVYQCSGSACSPTTFVATTTVLSYSVTSLTQSTLYGFAVSAVDAAFNESTKSSTFATTTTSSADVTSPTVSVTAPTNLATVSGSSVSVTANASDNIGVSGVQFKLDNVNLGSEDTTSTYGITWDSTSASNGSHTLLAVARDAAGNYATSTAITVTVSNTVPDTTAPVLSAGSPSGSLTAGTTTAVISVTTDENATCKYGTVSGTAYASIASTFSATGGTSHAHNLTSLTPASYTYYIRCIDSSSNANLSDYSISFNIPAPDTTAPTAPTSLTGTVSPTQVALTWASSTDAVGVTAYKIYKCTGSSCSPTTFVGTSTTLSYTVTSLTASTLYGFGVSAVDAAFNESTKSSTFATTTTDVDSIPPVISNGSPSGVLATSTNSITLSVTTDESASCKYSNTSGAAYASMLVSFTTTGGTTHSVNLNGLPARAYTFYVRCIDSASNANLSDEVISFSIPEDTTPSTSTRPPSRSGGGGTYTPPVVPITTYPIPTTTVPQVVVNLILQNRNIFEQASALGIVIPPYILQILGLTTSAPVNTIPTSPSGSKINISRDLTLNIIGTDVRRLQEFLISQNVGPAATALRDHHSTAIFGVLTKAALAEYQAAVGISPASGYFGPKTNAYVQGLGF